MIESLEKIGRTFLEMHEDVHRVYVVSATGRAMIARMTRDPLQQPRFGDVFEFENGSLVYRALFLSGSNDPGTMDDWTGLTLDDKYGIGPGEITQFASLNRGAWSNGWSFVDTLGGVAF